MRQSATGQDQLKRKISPVRRRQEQRGGGRQGGEAALGRWPEETIWVNIGLREEQSGHRHLGNWNDKYGGKESGIERGNNQRSCEACRRAASSPELIGMIDLHVFGWFIFKDGI